MEFEFSELKVSALSTTGFSSIYLMSFYLILESKLFLFLDHIFLYIENPEDSTKNLLQLINSVKLQDIKPTHKIQ
jgi:hypothetical protein